MPFPRPKSRKQRVGWVSARKGVHARLRGIMGANPPAELSASPDFIRKIRQKIFSRVQRLSAREPKKSSPFMCAQANRLLAQPTVIACPTPYHRQATMLALSAFTLLGRHRRRAGFAGVKCFATGQHGDEFRDPFRSCFRTFCVIHPVDDGVAVSAI
jgi:hypothetical protein